LYQFVEVAKFTAVVNGRGLNVFVRGSHKLLHNSSRAGHLTQCDCFGVCYILPNQQFFCKQIILWLLTKYICDRMKLLRGRNKQSY